MSSRKEFVKQIGIVAAGGCILGLSSLLESCGTNGPLTFKVEGKKISILLADFEKRKNKTAVLRDDELPGPVLLMKNEKGEYHAVLMICTHKGCELDVADTRLLCPCHGSQFSTEGKVLVAPANEDLISFPVEVSGDQIQISIPS